jgi:hypothetical protein
MEIAMQLYLDIIQAELNFQRSDIDPNAVLGYMRLKYGTLDHLGEADFRKAVLTIIAFANDLGKEALKEFAYHA